MLPISTNLFEESNGLLMIKKSRNPMINTNAIKKILSQKAAELTLNILFRSIFSFSRKPLISKINGTISARIDSTNNPGGRRNRNELKAIAIIE